jgi:heparan-alpha-glucosaminide N-acetyltransferase
MVFGEANQPFRQHLMTTSMTPTQVAPLARLATLDAFRGFVMLLMMAEVLQLSEVAHALPTSRILAFLGFHQSHVEWSGLSLHDIIQPGFSFLVGAALPFSIAARERQGQSETRIIAHAFKRAAILILLGFFLRSIGKPLTYFTFEDTLTQIGLGYGFLVLLGWQSRRVLWIVFAAILIGYWLLFALHAVPPPNFDAATVGVPKDWGHGFSGFAAHWNKNTNAAHAFDVWFLNLFPREQPFAFNEGGYQTLNFIPTLATMILGAIAADVLRSDSTPLEKVKWLAMAGAIGIASGALLGWIGVCPVVKRIWTPTWVLVSGGLCAWILAGLYAVIDWQGWRRWAFPLLVIGTNSIAAYVLTEVLRGPLQDLIKPHIGLLTTPFVGAAGQPLLTGAVVLAILFAILLQMYRRGMFLKV